MTHTPNMAVIRRVAGEKSKPRPRYDVDRHGVPVTEDTPDKRPWGLSTGTVRYCQSCRVKYPSGPLCGRCWALVKAIDAEDAAKEAANA